MSAYVRVTRIGWATWYVELFDGICMAEARRSTRAGARRKGHRMLARYAREQRWAERRERIP